MLQYKASLKDQLPSLDFYLSIFVLCHQTIHCIADTDEMDRTYSTYSAIAKAKPLFELDNDVVELTATRHAVSPTRSRQSNRDPLPNVQLKPIDIPFDLESIVKSDCGRHTPDKPSLVVSVARHPNAAIWTDTELSDDQDFDREALRLATHRYTDTQASNLKPLRLKARYVVDNEICILNDNHLNPQAVFKSRYYDCSLLLLVCQSWMAL